MVVTQHGLKCSSESARNLLSAIGVPLSGDTVLRDIHRMSVPERCEVKEIGVDSSRNSGDRFSTSHVQRSQRVTGRGTQHRPEEYRHGKDLFFMIYDLGAVATGDNYLDVNIYVIVPVWVLLLFLS